jgi:hypothetical protein
LTVSISGAVVGSNATTLTVTPVVGVVSFVARYGGTASLSATLGGPQVSGKSINFTLNGTPVGSAVTNSSGVATLPSASLGHINAGTYPAGVGATFGGDANDDDPSSGTAELDVGPALVTGSIQANPNPAAVGASVTFTATLNDGTGFAAGNVTLYDGTTPLQTVLVNTASCPGPLCNTASWSTSALAAGTHRINGIFSPSDGNNVLMQLSPVDQSITSIGPPTIASSFAASSVPLNATITLTFTISNPNANQSLTGIAFSDTLPAGVLVSPVPNLANGCGGLVLAAAGNNFINFVGGSVVAAASCQIKVDVKGAAAGFGQNTTTVITSNESGQGQASNTTSLYIVAPPVIGSSFSASTIPLNGTANLTVTLTNPSGNVVGLTGVGFSDTLPAGLAVATPNGLTTSCPSAITAAPGSGSIVVANTTLQVNASCQITLAVVGSASGTMTNSTGAVTSGNGGAGNSSTASLTVTAASALLPPVISLSFPAASFPMNTAQVLQFSFTNPSANTLPLTGLAFAITLPAGLSFSGSATPGPLCGTMTGNLAGQGPVSFSGASLQPSQQCMGSLGIQGTAPGTYTVTTTITSSNGGTGNTASASITITNSGPTNFRQLGVFRAASSGLGTFVLDMNTNYNFDLGVDRFISFGLSGDQPVAGDWAGTGTISLAVFRCPAAGVCQWYVDLNNNGTWDGTAGGDAIWTFGLSGDLPIVGDWTGDGITKIGVMRCPPVGTPGICTWYLDAGNKHAYDPATVRVNQYGLSGDLPVASQWGGSGTVDEIGVFRCPPAGGVCTWFVDSNNSGAFELADAQYSYGLTGDRPVVGNWFGSGTKRIGVFRSGAIILNLNGTNAWSPADFTGSFGLPGDIPVVGFWTIP